MSDQKIIFSMVGVGKTLPTGKKILDNIYLSFYYGAKIGVLGLNGSGKSTLLKIIAGLDKNHDGTIQAQPGLTIGMLAQEPDVLLLDEPTNHLDAESVEWLEQYLAAFPGTVIAVTHDRYFLDNVAGWMLELDRGKGIPHRLATHRRSLHTGRW